MNCGKMIWLSSACKYKGGIGLVTTYCCGSGAGGKAMHQLATQPDLAGSAMTT